MQVIPVDEGHGDARVAGAAGAADAVEVGLLVLRNRVVDDVRHVVDIDASCSDVRRDEHVLLASLERGHRALALLLVEVAVNGGSLEATIGELFHELRCGTLGAREDHGLAATFRLQDARDHLVFVERVCSVDDVLDVRLRDALVWVGRADVDRLRHEAACEGHDRAGHRRGEEHGVARRGRLGEETFDVGEEAEVEHLVGFVEHHLAHVGEVEHALLREVEEAARRANNDLSACLELFDLALVGLAAVDRHDGRLAARNSDLEVFVDLDSKFARRHDDKRLHAVGGV